MDFYHNHRGVNKLICAFSLIFIRSWILIESPTRIVLRDSEIINKSFHI
jgi:hypothetical protein